jgi:hypothetical protein
MATYVEILDAEIEPEAPIISSLGYRWRDNPIAIAQGVSGADVVAAGWHPYDKLSVGDSNDGTFYDAAIDGSVASVASPAFEDGYEYAVLVEGIGSASTTTFDARLYTDTSATWGAWIALTGAIPFTIAANRPVGFVQIPLPRFAQYYHSAPTQLGNTSGNIGIANPVVTRAARETVGGIEFRTNGTFISSGKLKLLRRREYTSA